MKVLSELEILIGHLAGREVFVDPDRSKHQVALENSLANPASDSSQFYAEIRRRTRSLFDDPATTNLEVAEDPPSELIDQPGLNGTGKGNRRRTLPIRVTALLLAILGSVLLADFAIRSLEGLDPARSRAQTQEILGAIRAEFARLNQLPARAIGDPQPNHEALTRLETSLATLSGQIEALARASVPKGEVGPGAAMGGPIEANSLLLRGVEPVGPVIANDLAALRRELSSSEAAMTRQIQELRTVLQEVNTVVRRVLNRPQPAPVASVTGPLVALAVQALTNNLQHPSAQVRGEAVEQLMRIGLPARSALLALQQRHNQESDQTVRATIEAAISMFSSN